MIENIQRTDLTAQDKENAIREMLEKGLSQKEIADLLSKPISYVSDIVAGTKVREQAEAAGVDTSSLKTRALAQLRSVNAEDLPGKVQELSEAGGTNAAATKILHEYKDEKSDDSEIDVPDFDESTIEPASISESDFYESEKSEKSTTHVSNKKEDFRRKDWKEWEAQTAYRLSIGISFENFSDAKGCLELIQNNFPYILYATHLFR